MEKNTLYPVFLKLSKLKVLLVGAGAVGLEKLSFMLKSSPDAQVTVLADWVSEPVRMLAEEHAVPVVEKAYQVYDLEGFNIIIAATNQRAINEQIYWDAKSLGKLVNVADTPDLCDFYMGSIVTKGPLKLAISTNGKSPTFAKRIREMLEDVLPDELDSLLENLHSYRKGLKLNFEEKVALLNKHTEILLKKEL